jgi:hypothetical protein
MLLIGFAGMLLEALRRNKAAGRNDHCLADWNSNTSSPRRARSCSSSSVPPDSVASPSADGSALRVSSGANPNNRNRHRQACRKGANNHQAECEKRICLWAGVVYRHVAYSTTRINRKASAGTNAVTVRTRVQEVRSDGAQRWLTKG